MKQFKYISKIGEEELNNNVVIPCTNEENMPCILIKNSLEKTVSNTYETDNLKIKLNAVLNYDDKKYYVHIVTSKNSDYYAIEQFKIIYEYIFKKLENSIDDTAMANLIISLEDYFKTTPDSNLKSLQIGVYGELLTLKKIYESGYTNIINKYHDNFYSKHDIEISDNLRIEIKTAVGEKRIHTFKHNQICRDDVDVFVASVLLEPAKEGYSLYNLFLDVLNMYSAYPDQTFAIRKLMKKCNVSNENIGPMFAYQKAYNDLVFFDAKVLPQLTENIPNGITNISYDVDCSLADEYIFIDFINLLKNNEE